MVLVGIIKRIVFKNEENSYTVAAVVVDGNEIIAVGNLPAIAEGEKVTLTGEYKKSSRFGEQFQVSDIQINKPEDAVAVERYLASKLFYGIGRVTAKKIVDTFGKDTLKIIENESYKLAQIPGISKKKAAAISEALEKRKDMQDAVLYLQKLGISMGMSMKVWKKYETETKRTVEQNPYKLVDDIEGIGFATADGFAAKMGVEKNSRFRVSAGITFTLADAVSKNGHTYLPREELLEESAKLLGLFGDAEKDVIVDVLSELEILGKLMQIENNGEKICMLTRHFLIERSIAKHLTSLVLNAESIDADLSLDIDKYEKESGISLHSGQRTAVECSVKNGVSVITGGPGTGKTTIIKCALSVFSGHGLAVQLCAPTGRAAKRMSEACGAQAKTIHRLLDIDFKDGDKKFLRNENQKIEADVLIVDEISMCDEYIFNSLIKAIKKGGRLIMVGDKDQLPSVGAGNVLADIIASGIAAVSYLTEIYRQGAEGLIIKNAHKINRGEMPVINNSSKDFFYVERTTPTEVLNTAIEMVTERLPKFTRLAGSEIQVLCPMKKGFAGVENMNTQLQAALNPPDVFKSELKVGATTLRVGDKIIHTANNYQLEWSRDDTVDGAPTTEEGAGVFNGDIGYIEAIDKSASTVLVRFEDGKVALYGGSDIDQLNLAYAISVHKSQGSEFNVVVIAISAGNPMILTRNLIYTAVTRAKRMVVVISQGKTLYAMIKNNFTSKRYSLLADFILKEKNNVSFLPHS